MAYFLCIETATPVCSVALCENDKVIELFESTKKNSHAEVVAVFIDQILKKTDLKSSDLSAIAVSKGPGSYTGLRIGVSTAKGLCYAINKPLIAVNTLHSMAAGLIAKQEFTAAPNLYCPMIDARRMEVYSALYNYQVEEVRETKAEIIDEGSFSEYLKTSTLTFFGDGAEKCQETLNHPNAIFINDFQPSAAYMANIIYQKYLSGQVEDVAYFEPFYLKDFVAGLPKVKGLR